MKTTEASTGETAALEGTIGIETALTSAECDKTNKKIYTLLYLTVCKAGRNPAGLILKSKSQTLTGGNGHRASLALMDKCKYGSEDTLRTAMRKFMDLKLEDGENPDILFFEAVHSYNTLSLEQIHSTMRQRSLHLCGRRSTSVWQDVGISGHNPATARQEVRICAKNENRFESEETHIKL